MAPSMPAVPVNEAAAAVAEQAASPAAVPSAVVASQPEESKHAANQDVALAMKGAVDEKHPGNGRMAVDGHADGDDNGGMNNVDDKCKVKVAADLANNENIVVVSAAGAAAAEIPSTASGADQNVLATKAVSCASVAVQTCEPNVGKKTGGSRSRSAHPHYVLRPMPPNFFNLGPHSIEALSSARRAKVPADTLLAMLRRREISPHFGQSLFQPGLIVIRRQSFFTRATPTGYVRETIGLPTFTTYQCEPAVNCLGTSSQTGPHQGPPPIQVVPIWINNGHEATSGRPLEEHITVVVTIAPSKALLRPAFSQLEQQPAYLPTVYHEHRLFITVNELLQAEPGLVVVHESQRMNLDYGQSGVEIPLLTTTFGSPLSAPGHYTACKRDIDYHVPVAGTESSDVTWQRKTVRLVLIAGQPDYRGVVTGWSVIGSSTPNLALK